MLWHLQFKEKKRAKKKNVFKKKIASQVCSPLVFRVFSRCVFHYWNEVLFLILRLGVFKMNCAILHLQICVVKMQMFCICVVKYLNTYWMNEIFEGGFFSSNLSIFFFSFTYIGVKIADSIEKLVYVFHDKVWFLADKNAFFVENNNISTVLFDTYLYIVIRFVTDL